MTSTASWLAVVLLALHGLAHAQPQPLRIGQSAGLTGGQAKYSADVKVGIEAALAAANKQGGINGRQVQLVSEDDGGKREQVVANTKKLVEQHKVVALIGYTSGAGTEASLEYIGMANVPMIAPVTGNMGIRAAHHKQLFHTRAGYGDEMRKIIDALATTGVKRFAFAYLDDVGPANPQSMHDALTRHNLKAVAAVPLNRNADDFGKQVDALMQAQPEFVVFISNAKPIVRVVTGMRARGYKGQFATSSFSGVGVIEDLQNAAFGLIMSQVLPPPTRTNLRFVADYQKHLREYDAQAKPNYTNLEGYLAARVLLEGLRRAGTNPGSDRVITALEELNRFDLGGYEITFTSANHNGSRFVDTAVVSMDGKLRF
jgi:ABC-type branched-subunit amino acid transport system substrate-binding protein